MNPSVYVLGADFGRYTDTFEKEGYIKMTRGNFSKNVQVKNLLCSSEII
jgi:hypothetical protein